MTILVHKLNQATATAELGQTQVPTTQQIIPIAEITLLAQTAATTAIVGHQVAAADLAAAAIAVAAATEVAVVATVVVAVVDHLAVAAAGDNFNFRMANKTP